MIRAYILVLVCILSLFSACKPRAVAVEPESTRRIMVEPRRLNAFVTGFGTVQSASTSVIRSPSGGRVAAIHVERGQYIDKGDLLLEVTNERYTRQRDEQESKVKSCEWTLIKKERERDSKQGAERSIADADVEVARIDLENARRRLETATEDLNDCKVRAPFAGTVMAVETKVGDLVTASGEYSLGTALFQVVGSSDYVVEVSLGEVEMSRIDSSCRVEVRLPAVFGETFPAKIKTISQAGRRSDRGQVFPVAVGFSAENSRVKLGLSAEVRFVLNTKETAAAVPISAVHFDEKGPWLSVDSDGRRERRYVKLGLNDSAFVEILSGIGVGDRIIE